MFERSTLESTPRPRRRPVEDALAGVRDRNQEALSLQRRVGNRAAARMLARKPTMDQVALLMSHSGNTQLGQLSAELDQVTLTAADYLRMDPDDQEGRPGLAALGVLKNQAKLLDDRLIRLREELKDTGTTTTLHEIRQTVFELFKAANVEHALLRRKINKAEYKQQVEPNTIKALDARTAKYMLVSTQPGIAESEARGASEYPEDVPADQKLMLALPPTDKQTAPLNEIKDDGKAVAELDVLVIAGSHGGVRALFEQEGHGVFYGSYWEKQVVPQLLNRVRAHHIVLDACLTASMIDIFRPLLTPGGKIVCSTYSVNGRFMTPSLWKAIIAETANSNSTQAVGGLLDQRFGEFKGEARANTAEALVGTIKSSDPGELQRLLAKEPSAAELISKIRYLPKLHDAIAGYVAGNETSVLASTKVASVLGLQPDPAPDEQLLGAMLMSALQNDQPDTREAVATMFRESLQGFTNSQEQDLEKLVSAGRGKAQSDARAIEATNAPTHLAVFDNPTSTLRFDEQLDKPEGVERVTYSTGSPSRGEIANLRYAIGQMGITLQQLPVGQLQT